MTTDRGEPPQKAFRRIFAYILPQWPRLIAVFVSVLVICLLLSISFMTIIPLLTVMMEDEGLHGWVDRKACQWQYGLEFSIPGATELAEGSPLRSVLLVTGVKEKSLAYYAGITKLDRITDVNNIAAREPSGQAPYTRLLIELAGATRETVPLKVIRSGDNKALETKAVKLATPQAESYLKSLDWGPFDRLRWQGSLAALRVAQWTVSFLPREQNARNKIQAVVIIMFGMVVITIIRCTAKFYQDYLGEKIVQIGINHLREDVFAHLTYMPMSAFARERPSDAVSRIVRDTNILGTAIKVLLGKGLREPFTALFLAGTAMWLNWQLTLIFLCGAPFVVGALGFFGSKMKKATRRSLVVSSQMLAKLQEAMIGLRVIKVYNRQQHEQQLFKGINDRLLKQLLRMSKAEAATHPVLEVLGIMAGAAAIYVGMSWTTTGTMKGPDFLAVLALLATSAESVRKTSDIWNRIQQGNAAAERVFEVLDRPIEIEKPGAAVLPPAKGIVEFRDIVFTYPGAEHPALNGVSLTVAAGCNVAIVGPNGSGKTTLANLLPRFYDPDSGQVLIDGVDIRDVTLASLRDHIGMVTQEVITFNDTISANIAYGRHDSTQEQIVEAAKRVFAHEFISRLPEGYATVIGEHGVGLSGGQLQRIIIARAILKNPAILIFDEATSQVDADSEAKIHRAIEELMQNRTTFIIAHRFSTVVSADMIVVMNNGKIAAQGQHEELLQTCPVYQGLCETQLIRA